MITPALIDEHYGAMHRLARLVGREPRLARDAVRAAWLAAHGGLDGRPEGSSARGWLLAAVLRALAAPPPPHEHAPAAAERELEPEGTRWAGWWKDELAATAPVHDEALEDAVAAIPAGLAAIFVLRDVEGLGEAEVAALLGHDPELQLDLLQHARAAIRNALREPAASAS